MNPVHFQAKPFNITVIQVYFLTSSAKEAEVEWFYEHLQDLLERTPIKDVLFIIGDWNAKAGSQEISQSNRQVGPWAGKLLSPSTLLGGGPMSIEALCRETGLVSEPTDFHPLMITRGRVLNYPTVLK